MESPEFIIVSVIASAAAGVVFWFFAKGAINRISAGGLKRQAALFVFFGEPWPLIKRFSDKTKIEFLLSTGFAPASWSARRVLFMKQWSALAVVFVAILYLGAGVSFVYFLIVVSALLIIAFVWPVFYLKRIISAKKRVAERELPMVIDYLRLYVGAGMGLENAWKSMAERLHGAWSAEWKKVALEMDHGIGFLQSLERMEQRVGISDMTRFVSALAQAKHLGASIYDTLAIQSEAIRTRRRQMAEELTKTASVKTSIPLVLFIFPSLLIIYLGPAVLRLFEELRG